MAAIVWYLAMKSYNSITNIETIDNKSIQNEKKIVLQKPMQWVNELME